MKHIIIMCFYLKAFPNLQKIGGLEFVSLGYSEQKKNIIFCPVFFYLQSTVYQVATVNHFIDSDDADFLFLKCEIFGKN